MKIITHPNPILRKKSEIIKADEILKYQKMLPEMTQIMLDKDGIGLAAPQIGKNIRLIIINKDAAGTNEHLILFNPKITYISKKTRVMEEGCLSLPGIFGEVDRPEKIRVKAYDQQGEKKQIKAKGLLARVLQHEIDHLDGILFINKLKA